MNTLSDYELFDSPSDGISALAFHPSNADILLASSWDGSAYTYSVTSNRIRAKLSHPAPLLDLAFSSSSPDTRAFAGTLDGRLLLLDLHGYRTECIGEHQAAIKSVCVCNETRSIFSGDWDALLNRWDERVNSSNKKPASSMKLPDKVYSMDLVNHMLIVGMANRHIYLFDTRHPEVPLQRRESPLKYQTRSVRLVPDATGYVCTSVEGRVAVEWTESTEASKRYAFKCHRQAAHDGQELVFPVNAAAFCPVQPTAFCTGGSDGVVAVWDAVGRRRIKQIGRYPSSISALQWSKDGRFLAIASSYGFEEGEKEYILHACR